MKILILGNMRSGKDTLAELLNEYFGMTYRSSSEMANELFIYDTIKDEYGYQSIEECFEDRVNHRSLWYKLICFFNKEDKSKLAKAILKENDCYVGMRDLEEFEASKHLFDIIIWVDASKRLGNSEITNKISIEDAHIVVHNNGTFEEFQEKAKVIGKLLFKK
jgi:dephospho-CoA kinase